MMRFRRCALFTFWVQSNVRLVGSACSGSVMAFMRMVLWFQWAGSGSSSSSRYESRPRCQTLPCFSSGEYKSHTVWLRLSLMPPQPCGRLWTDAWETRAEAAGSQWKRGMTGLCPCMSLVRPQQQRPVLGHGGRREGREFNHSGGFF